MTRVRRAAATGCVGLLAVLVLTGCSHGGTSPAAAPTTTASTDKLTTNPEASIQNIVISDYVRAQLLVAEAKAANLPKTAFAGFERTEEHFSYDGSTKTFWGGAQMVANTNAAKAKQALTGAGSYLIFSRQDKAKNWKVYKTGLGACPVQIPAAVLTAWSWPAGTCRPGT
jgi:hypothetical protein